MEINGVFDAQMSDAELVQLARNGNSKAEEALVVRYSWLVRVAARPLFLLGGDGEDLVQEGMLGLLAAVREYRKESDVSFKTFADTCIRNRLISAIRAASRDKHIPLNSYIPLDPALFDDSKTDERRNDDQQLLNPETLIIEREDFQERMNLIYTSLSPLESRVLRLYLSGMSYSEIASECKRSLKSVDNTVQRIRRKLARQA